ncbi:hypothetical protein [Novosphingobium sp. KA1]|uniref:hypothetical protein n=1 Tax=Novosphingobium sp. (strain KA1) TaxID=164608 RepID=UPI001A9080A7|nr:hypothetical protein [Novosphingobium sp. KA1]QSR17439.1 hypothetical protein CA833_09630 [Novosphingobium sp. KA1]
MSGGDRIEVAARYLAAQGEVEIRRIRAILERAQHLLDAGDLSAAQITALRRPAPYAWEKPQLFPIEREVNVYQAVAEDHATGQGHDLYYHASFARSVEECRRHFATAVGPHLANAAIIGCGHDADIRHADLFMSLALREFLECGADPDRRPTVLRYDAHLHFNAS